MGLGTELIYMTLGMSSYLEEVRKRDRLNRISNNIRDPIIIVANARFRNLVIDLSVLNGNLQDTRIRENSLGQGSLTYESRAYIYENMTIDICMGRLSCTQFDEIT